MAKGIRVRTRTDIPRVLRRVRKANITSLKHAGGVIRLTARRSIRRKPYRFKTLPSGAKRCQGALYAARTGG